MVRLVFRPYAQVRRSICTSEPLRTSTRVSPGFVLLKHSSPSFGYHRVRSGSTSASRGRPALRRSACPRGGSCLRESIAFVSPWGLASPADSRTRWTPWSVFQDGSGGGRSKLSADLPRPPEGGRSSWLGVGRDARPAPWYTASRTGASPRHERLLSADGRAQIPAVSACRGLARRGKWTWRRDRHARRWPPPRGRWPVRQARGTRSWRQAESPRRNRVVPPVYPLCGFTHS